MNISRFLCLFIHSLGVVTTPSFRYMPVIARQQSMKLERDKTKEETKNVEEGYKEWWVARKKWERSVEAATSPEEVMRVGDEDGTGGGDRKGDGSPK